jgi:cytochrome c oxidase assembly protein subunit 15
MANSTPNRWLHRFAVLTALATLALIGIGGLVTSHGVGMAVPDWPTTYGYNMFVFPISQWVGGIFYEHSHRLVASVVGLLVIGLTRWVGGRPARLPLALIGVTELLAGWALLSLGAHWKGAGYFLSGIGGMVLIASVIWVRNRPLLRPLPLLAWIAFATVQIQGLLGGLRVVLFKDELGIFHAALAQLFFVVLCLIALLTSRWWQGRGQAQTFSVGAQASSALRVLLLLTTVAILVQLILGATMRHQHAGLAISDFPLAYGKLWPAIDAQSVNNYNQQRMETTALNPITSAQIVLQMSHRILAMMILCGTGVCAWVARRSFGRKHPLSRLALLWLGIIVMQALLGAGVIWSNKAADVATAHVLIGAISLALGVMLITISLPASAAWLSISGSRPRPEFMSESTVRGAPRSLAA